MVVHLPSGLDQARVVFMDAHRRRPRRRSQRSPADAKKEAVAVALEACHAKLCAERDAAQEDASKVRTELEAAQTALARANDQASSFLAR